MIVAADDFGRYGFSVAIGGGNYSRFDGVLSATHVRKGTASFKMVATGGLGKVLPHDSQDCGLSFAWYMDGLPSTTGDMTLCEWRDNNNKAHAGVAVMASGKVLAYRGDGRGYESDKVYGESDRPVMTTRGFNYIECYCVADTTDGIIEVRVNGVTVLNFSGINTNGVGAEADTIAMTATGTILSGILGYPDTYMTDPIWWNMQGTENNDFMGDKYVGSQLADADTPTAQWIPAIPGSHYQMVNNVPPLDNTEYITAMALGKQEAFSLANLPAEVVAINAVIPFARSEKTDAADMRLKLAALSGAAQENGPEEVLTTSFRYYEFVSELNPDTLAPWTVAGFNAAQILLTRTV